MPKTMKNKFENALTYNKLMEAHLKCQKGKKRRDNIIKFNLKKEDYIQWLLEKLRNRTYVHRRIYSFLCVGAKSKKSRSSKIYR